METTLGHDLYVSNARFTFAPTEAPTVPTPSPTSSPTSAPATYTQNVTVIVYTEQPPPGIVSFLERAYVYLLDIPWSDVKVRAHSYI